MKRNSIIKKYVDDWDTIVLVGMKRTTQFTHGIHKNIRLFLRPDELRGPRFVFVGTALVMLGAVIFSLVFQLSHLPPDSMSASGTTLFTYRGQAPQGIYTLAWSPDGKRIASGSQNVQVWDTSNSQHVLTLATSEQNIINTLAWSPDGKYLVTGGATLDMWDAQTGQKRKTFISNSPAGERSFTAVSWSPDGSMLAAASRIAPKNKSALQAATYTVDIWKIASVQHLFTYHGHKNTVSAVLWSPDSKRIASASYDQSIQVWEALSGKHLVKLGGKSAYVGLDWSHDGRFLASIGDISIDVWRADTGKLLHSISNLRDDKSVRWSPDDKRLASAYNDVHIWNAATGDLLFTYSQRFVRTIGWSPDGKWLASGDAITERTRNAGVVQVWKTP